MVECAEIWHGRNMDWGYGDFGYQNSLRISSAESAAERADSKARRAEQELDQLGRHVERMSLASQAMWELIRERTSLSEEDLEAKMLEVDGRDGVVDGKISVRVQVCDSCGRNTNSRRDTCIMCGAPIERAHKFE